MKEKYYLNLITEEIYKGIKPYKEITKEEYYVRDYANRYKKNLYRNFTSIYDFCDWCNNYGLNIIKVKLLFQEIGHPMGFVTSLDIGKACEELDKNEEIPHWVDDFRNGNINISEDWEIILNGAYTDLYLL